MKQGVPTITAPLSRGRTKRRSSPNVGLICAIISAVVAFIGTLILAIAMITSHSSSSTHNNNGNNDSNDDVRRKNKAGGSSSSSLRQSQSDVAALNNAAASIEQADIISNHHNTMQHNMMHMPPPAQPQGLLIHTHLGDIHIQFTPELSGPSSISYITKLVTSISSKQNSGSAAAVSSQTINGRKVTEGYKCHRCQFYRAEKQLLLQGVIAEPSIPKGDVTLGPCPIDNYVPKNKCPDHDPNCGCHGPVMTKGMVGWAGGGVSRCLCNVYALSVLQLI